MLLGLIPSAYDARTRKNPLNACILSRKIFEVSACSSIRVLQTPAVCSNNILFPHRRACCGWTILSNQFTLIENTDKQIIKFISVFLVVNLCVRVLKEDHLIAVTADLVGIIQSLCECEFIKSFSFLFFH